ncbi:MAG: methyltransferase domain-containing protein [Flavobacteriales bacterium]|nr:methyltransferase domain-containing protein [Flavobacteriales bacterium]
MFHFLLRTIPRPILIRLSYIFSFFSPVFYGGNKYECPVCEGHFRKFLPYGYDGAAKRENVLCPKCLTLERHRVLWLYLKERTDFFTKPRKMLHIAPEQPFLGRFRKMKHLDLTTADLFSPLADVKCDIQDMPFEDNTFDVIFCNHVLEHVDDDHKAMSELYRVMKPGGFGIFQVPIDYTNETTLEDPNITSEEDRVKYYWQKDHVRLYGMDYPSKLEVVGFNAQRIDMAEEVGDELRDRYRLGYGDKVYRVDKS